MLRPGVQVRPHAGQQHDHGREELQDLLNDGDAGDLFVPGTAQVFGGGAGLAAHWWDGTPAGLQIRDLVARGDDLEFRVELG